MASNPTPKTSESCSVPGCGKPIRARGFCVACYYRKLRRGDLIAGTQTAKFKHRLTDIDEEKRTAICAECGPVKIRRRSKGKNQWRCGTDADYRCLLYKRAYRQSRKAMLADKCEICGSHKILCWDHDHKTGKFRGTLCSRCNRALGGFCDNIEFLLAAARYLEKSRSEIANS